MGPRFIIDADRVIGVLPHRGLDRHFTFDLADLPVVRAARWHIVDCGRGRVYVRRAMDNAYLHRVLVEPSDGQVVDHIDGNGLDNRRANLRAVSHRANIQNQRSRPRGRSRFRGVCWHKQLGRWRAYAARDGRQVSLGTFSDEEEAGAAAAAYRRENYEGFLDVR